MITVETLQELYDYNYWARDRQLDACAKLAPEQFLRPMGNSFASLRDTLAHLLGAEWVWLERFQGRSPRTFPSSLKEPQTLAELREQWSGVEQGQRQYLAGLEPAALTRPLTYVNLKGETWTYPLGQTLFHLANHQTYHRGEVTTLIRQLGAAAAAVDFLVYLGSRQKAAG